MTRSIVLFLAKNSIGSLVGYISFLLNKTVPIMIDNNLDQQLLYNLINKYKLYIWIPSEENFILNKAELKLDILGYRL